MAVDEKTKPPSLRPGSGAGMPGGFAANLCAEELLQNGVFERFCSAQPDNGLRLDFDRLTGGRVAPHACFAVSLYSSSQSGNYKFARAPLEFFNGELKEFIEKGRRLLLRNRLVLRAHFLSHMRDDLGLAQRICHRVPFASSELVAHTTPSCLRSPKTIAGLPR